MVYQIPDNSEPYNIDLLNLYLRSLCQSHLSDREYQVLRLSYGLDCEKHSATEIAKYLGIEGSSSYVRVSKLKKKDVDKLIEKMRKVCSPTYICSKSIFERIRKNIFIESQVGKNNLDPGCPK